MQFVLPLLCAMALPCRAQMDMAGMLLMQQASGTSMNPQSWRMPMFMPPAGSWSLMFMGQAFLLDTQQSGPRGGDKLYSTSWFMAAATHPLGRGSLMVQLMLSLEPATVTGRRYPELFQTGETAFGKPIVDGQHPHNLIMGLALTYARPIGGATFLELYAAPVGDPALGPVAFPHRASASELPQAPLGHHWQDSTHIAYDVVTAALKRRWARLEASGFHGAEPGENRWTIGYGPMDSWSTRFSVLPSSNWMAQVSVGRLTHPEALGPGDVVRATASLHYSRPMGHSPAGRESWSSSLIWGRNHDTFTHRNLNSYLAETVLPVGGRNFLTGRWELVDKDELLSSGAVFRIGACTLGFTHDLPGVIPGVEAGIGANATAYTLPEALQPYYGAHPFGVNVYLRFRLKPAH
ncbi:MAG: hypothetical protein ACLQU1_17030 [Bryobacteraceae bacterium]